MFAFLFICSLLVPLFMVIAGRKWSENPPTDINGTSGYRTTMSRLNQDTWNYAHKYWGRLNYILGIILIIVCTVILIFIKNNSDFESRVTYMVFNQIGIMVLTMIPTEIKLNQIFTKRGTRKGFDNLRC